MFWFPALMTRCQALIWKQYIICLYCVYVWQQMLVSCSYLNNVQQHFSLSPSTDPHRSIPSPQDNDISKSKVRYYSNSLQHRVKNRVWQTLLLLLPKLREVRKWLHDRTRDKHPESNCLFLCVCARRSSSPRWWAVCLKLASAVTRPLSSTWSSGWWFWSSSATRSTWTASGPVSAWWAPA